HAAKLDHDRAANLDRRGRRRHEGHQAERCVYRAADGTIQEVQRRDRSVMPAWKRLGLLPLDTSSASWAATHAALPIVEPLNDPTFRVYLSLRDRDGRARIGHTTLEMNGPPRLTPLDARPVLDLGALGAFDDSGVTSSSLVQVGARRILYYTGWSRGVTV